MAELTPSQKGAVAEAAITAMVIELGFTVLRPLCEGQRYDLVVDLKPELLRFQCKLSRLVEGVLSVNLKSNRCTPAGYVSTSYTADEIDAVAVFTPALRRGFLLPIAEVAGRRAVHLRLAPTKNNQADRIRRAGDYEIGTVLPQRADGSSRSPMHSG
jgi:hypothetical protein